MRAAPAKPRGRPFSKLVDHYLTQIDVGLQEGWTVQLAGISRQSY
ncbi:hypothetical protein Z950_383 [Sulfitobacter mediterraneus KCTC 32188]|nr:hypothetical protein Z950_383 [Sulfitobacter mediterraneus KCTC 32188]